MGYTDWRTSDELLDSALDGLAFFADFLAVYDEAARLAGRGQCVGIVLADLRDPYDELCGIDFAMLRADAEHLHEAIDAAESHRLDLDRYWGGLAGWRGDAATAAAAHRDRLDGVAAAFVRRASNAPGAIAGAVTAIQDALGRYTMHVLELRGERCGGLTVGEVREAIDWGDGRALGYVVDEFDARKAAFDAYTSQVRREIQDHYDVMLEHLRPLTEEAFADLPEPAPFGTAAAPSSEQLAATGAAGETPATARPVTISQGGNTLALSTPDDQGRVRLAVLDGAGHSRTYELDFGTPAGGTGAAGTMGGGAGPSGGGSVTPLPSAGGGSTPASEATGPVVAGGRARRRATPSAPAPRLPSTLFPWTTTKPVDRLHPDEDGRVVIKDGKVMITVKADDDADQLTITLDDGAGNRTSYRVDYADPANPTLRREAAEPVALAVVPGEESTR